MTNFASHVKDAGLDPKTIPLTFFRKSSASISERVRSDRQANPTLNCSTTRWRSGLWSVRDRIRHKNFRQDLPDVIAGLVITNDVSARDVQLPQTQFYEAKSIRVSPRPVRRWSCSTCGELKHFRAVAAPVECQQRRSQELLVDGDMMYSPAARSR